MTRGRSIAAAPDLPLARPTISPEDAEAVAAVVRSGVLTNGPLTPRFERHVATHVGAEEVIAVATGTAALHAALATADLTPGDRVVLPSFTYAATAQAVLAVGAEPVFADVDPVTLCLDPRDVAVRAQGARAIVAVWFNGSAGAAPALRALADELGIPLVVDAAHAFGCLDPDGPVGSGPETTCFSFGPIKTITCGTGGAVATSDPDRARRIRRFTDLGLPLDPGGVIEGPGLRYRMPEPSAALGLSQLARIGELAAHRRRLWAHLDAGLAEHPNVTVVPVDLERTIPLMAVVRVGAEARAQVRDALAARGVATGLHYPPLHRSGLVTTPAELPVTERAAAEVVSLPFHAGMALSDVERVVDAVGAAVTQPLRDHR